jgi:hypothetical protein
MKRVLAGVLTGCIWLVLPAGVAQADPDQLAALRQATVKYHDVRAAEADHYLRTLDCFDSEAGGMGQHYIDVPRIDGVVEAGRPEAMVYQVRPGGRLQLVAVEYIAPETAPRPTLYGQQFHHNTVLGLWVLHAWIWKANPAGVFADYNPDVPDCD